MPAMIDINAVIARLERRAVERPDLGCDPHRDIAWAEALSAPETADDFAMEVIFVICNSGMRFTVARGIYDRVMLALRAGIGAFNVFKHPGKAAAIDTIWHYREVKFKEYVAATDKLAFLVELEWIGDITKYHLAKNFGLSFAKPDVHLMRLAVTFRMPPQELCEALAASSGYTVATVDTLLWRAAAVGVLNTITGEIL